MSKGNTIRYWVYQKYMYDWNVEVRVSDYGDGGKVTTDIPGLESQVFSDLCSLDTCLRNIRDKADSIVSHRQNSVKRFKKTLEGYGFVAKPPE